MEPLELEKHITVITNIIDYLRQEEQRDGKYGYVQIENLRLTPELDVDLNCVGLSAYQIGSICLIAWSKDIEQAKSSYLAEEEYNQLKKVGPKEDT